MQVQSDPSRVAFLPETDAEAEILLDVMNGARDTEDLLSWTTCDGADYDELDAEIEDGVLVLSSRPSSDPWLNPNTVLSLLEDAALALLVAIGMVTVWRWFLAW